MSGVRFFGSAVVVAAALALATHGMASGATGPRRDDAATERPTVTSAARPTGSTGHTPTAPSGSDVVTAPGHTPPPPAASSPVSSPPPVAPPPSTTPTTTDSATAAAAPTPAPPVTGSPAATGSPTVTGSPAPTAPTAPEGGVIHLSFDDGPDPAWTPQLLALLRQHGARATFFEIGQQAAAHPELVAAVRAGGNTIGNHTWSHPNLATLSSTQAAQEVARTQAVLGARCLRPPYGAIGGAVKDIAASTGLALTLWDVDTRDWQRPGAAVIAERAVAQAHDGATILLHDGGVDRSQTLEAVATILSTLEARGWRFEPIPGC